MVTFGQAQLEAWLAGVLLPFLRVLALCSAAPLLSQRSFPMRGRVAFAFLLAIVAAPFAPVPAGGTLASPAGMGLVAEQVAIGLALGFAARLVFAAFELAGEVIGLQMGLSFAGFFQPGAGSGTAAGSWLHTLALLLFLSADGHLLLVDGVVRSFAILPIGGGLAALARPDLLAADMFRLAATIALPATLVLLFVNLVLGFVSRVAPQLSIFAVGFPVTLMVGMAALLLIARELDGYVAEAMRLIGR